MHLTDSPSVAKCIVRAPNYTQTIHKLYIEAFQTLHSERSKPTQREFAKLYMRHSKPYTTSVRETIHEAEHKPYILFLNTNLANGI